MTNFVILTPIVRQPHLKTHWLTTIFGFLLAFSQAALNSPGLDNDSTLKHVGGILGVVSALGLGAAAADNRKVTNGKDSVGRDSS